MALKAQGAKVLGLERSAYPVHPAIANDVYIGSLSDPEITGRTFDLVILWHVLEHLSLTDRLIEDVHELLENDGLLAISVPNYASLQRAIFRGHWFHLDLPRHLVHLEAEWLSDRLTKAGFQIVSSGHVDLVQNIYGFIQSALNLMFPAHPNTLYRWLMCGRKAGSGYRVIALHVALATLLLPFAFLETVLSSLTRQGATVKILARKGN
jgi:SAM-dependent methyltransferase